MGSLSRRKGAQGEREVLGLLREALGDPAIKRNLDQVRDGGGDCAVLVGGMLLEVKRWGKKSYLPQAMQQARQACVDYHEKHAFLPVPVVVWRMDGDKDWRFTVDGGLEDFCLLVREGVFSDG